MLLLVRESSRNVKQKSVSIERMLGREMSYIVPYQTSIITPVTRQYIEKYMILKKNNCTYLNVCDCLVLTAR